MPAELTSDNRARVTVIGLGPMGRALAGAFLDRGHPTTVWNRTPGKADDLTVKGALQAATVADAMSASPLVIACLRDDKAVREVLGQVPEHVLAGRTFVNLTNGTPRQARDLAEMLHAHQAEYVDGGIMAVPPMIGQPGAFVLYSGSEEAFRAHEETLRSVGSATWLGPDAGRAALYDIALLSAMYGMFGGFLHAVALTRSEGVPTTEFTPLVVSWLKAMLEGLPGMAAAVGAGDHSTATSTVVMQAGAYVNLLDASADQGVDVDLVAPMGRLLDRGVAAGRGDGAISGLADLLSTASKPTE